MVQNPNRLLSFFFITLSLRLASTRAVYTLLLPEPFVLSVNQAVACYQQYSLTLVTFEYHIQVVLVQLKLTHHVFAEEPGLIFHFHK